MKTTSPKKGKRKNEKKCAISVKAYDEFTTRIRSALENHCDACSQTLRLLDSAVGYSDETINLWHCLEEVRIVYSLLKPEIDKAIKRSKVARERAGRKKRSAIAETIAADIVTPMPEEENCGDDCAMEQPSAVVDAAPEPVEDAVPEQEQVPEQEPMPTPQLSRRKRRQMMRRKAYLRKKAAKKAQSEQGEKQSQC